jgi:hypothetical protein
MSGKGALIFDGMEVTGYLIVGGVHYEIMGKRMSEVRAHLHVTEISEQQEDLFDGRSGASGERKRDHS